MKIGSRVSHLSFGEGTVVEIQQDFVVVDFDKFGRKNMISSFLEETATFQKNIEKDTIFKTKDDNKIRDEEILNFLIYRRVWRSRI